jgi:hypothetical protein
MSRLTIEMHNPQRQLLEEVKLPGITQDSVALTYAFIMAQEGNSADWPKINQAIIARWPKGLNRVKKIAWKQMEKWGLGA